MFSFTLSGPEHRQAHDLKAGTDDKANALHGWTCLSLALSAEGVTLLIDTNLRRS